MCLTSNTNIPKIAQEDIVCNKSFYLEITFWEGLYNSLV